MGSRKQGISDETNSISDEEEVKSENNSGGGGGPAATAPGKRSYECTFCKRGFTNAQALGGHMNIHRKDRAKAKQLAPGSSSSSVSTKPNMNPNFAGRVNSGQTMDYYPVTGTRSYFQQQQGSDGNYGNGLMDFQGNFRSNERIWGENLSLRVGSNHDSDGKIGGVSKEEEELDLELRLGHDRYRLS